MTDRDQEEQDWRIEHMIEDVVQKRMDAIYKAAGVGKMQAEMRHESRKVMWQAIAALGGAFTGGAALMGLLLHYFGRA